MLGRAGGRPPAHFPSGEGIRRNSGARSPTRGSFAAQSKRDRVAATAVARSCAGRGGTLRRLAQMGKEAT